MRCSLLKLHVEIKKKQCLKITSNCVFKATVYRVIFRPCYFALLHLQTVSPRLNFAQTHFCIRDNLGHWNSPCLKFAI